MLQNLRHVPNHIGYIFALPTICEFHKIRTG